MIPPRPDRNPSGRPRIHFIQSLSGISVPSELLHGVDVVQVSAHGGTKMATLRLSQDKFTLRLSEAKNGSSGGSLKPSFLKRNKTESERSIDIGEMDRIQRGQSTHQFEKAKKKAGSAENIIKRQDLTRRQELVRGSSVQSNISAGTVSSASTGSNMLATLDPERSFSIIFRGSETLDLMAESESERDEICNALDKILTTYQMGKTRVADDVLLLRYALLEVDKDKTGFVNVQQVGKILQQINFSMKHRELQKAYDHFGKVIGLDRGKRKGGLNFEQTAVLVCHMIKRDSWIVKPVTVLWNDRFGQFMNNGKPRETVSLKSFLDKFLHGTQGETQATLLDARKLFHRLHEKEIAHISVTESLEPNRITKDHFEAFLVSRENAAFDPDKEKVNESDMSQPLSEYWINSSHNTYLIGDQYTSQSSVEMYSNALYRGCRCLELDIWDGARTAKGPVPVVWHGMTMTTQIRFVDIIRTIKVFLNFHPDTYPIVLSFENHCSLPYQEVMAEQLHRILGESLYIPTEASLYGALPSPAQLRGMVVVKGRRPDGTEADCYDSDEESDEEKPDGLIGTFQALEQDRVGKSGKKGKTQISPQLARLTLFHGHSYKSFEDSIRTPTHHMHSFSENKVRSLCRQKLSNQMIAHNQRHMSRTYPAGSRVDSSNYNPMLAWSTGCQMVALNFQTQDAFLRLNDGRFRENGNCGYVLKPSALMIVDDYTQATTPVRLSVRVLSGSCLPKPKGQRSGDCIDPYVKVSAFDVKHDKDTITAYSTGVVQSNGFFPIWNQEKFDFAITSWAVAVLQFTVYEKNRDEFIACATIPISCLRRGIRSVKLFDSTNSRSGAFDFATLLCHIKIGEVVAEI